MCEEGGMEALFFSKYPIDGGAKIMVYYAPL